MTVSCDVALSTLKSPGGPRNTGLIAGRPNPPGWGWSKITGAPKVAVVPRGRPLIERLAPNGQPSEVLVRAYVAAAPRLTAVLGGEMERAKSGPGASVIGLGGMIWIGA